MEGLKSIGVAMHFKMYVRFNLGDGSWATQVSEGYGAPRKALLEIDNTFTVIKISYQYQHALKMYWFIPYVRLVVFLEKKSKPDSINVFEGLLDKTINPQFLPNVWASLYFNISVLSIILTSPNIYPFYIRKFRQWAYIWNR